MTSLVRTLASSPPRRVRRGDPLATVAARDEADAARAAATVLDSYAIVDDDARGVADASAVIERIES